MLRPSVRPPPSPRLRTNSLVPLVALFPAAVYGAPTQSLSTFQSRGVGGCAAAPYFPEQNGRHSSSSAFELFFHATSICMFGSGPKYTGRTSWPRSQNL